MLLTKSEYTTWFKSCSGRTLVLLHPLCAGELFKAGIWYQMIMVAHLCLSLALDILSSKLTLPCEHILLGYVCSALSIDPWSRCCPRTGARFSCQWVSYLLLHKYQQQQRVTERWQHCKSNAVHRTMQGLQPWFAVLQFLRVLCFLLLESF